MNRAGALYSLARNGGQKVTVWAIVPVKPLKGARSKLSNALTAKERISLGQQMLKKTLQVLADSPSVEKTLVVSHDSDILSLARKYGAQTITEGKRSKLNQALERATQVARGYEVSAVLFLPADLPLICKDAVEDIAAKAGDPPVVVIVPDRHDLGTNALLVSPPGLIKYCFGTNSFECHVELANKSGARVEISKNPELSLDIDSAEDLEILRTEQGKV
jgi:2-phospho-L-lactate guanylyltransferase